MHAEQPAAIYSQEYYLLINDETVGPLSRDEIAKRLASGTLSPTTLCSYEGADGWKQVRDLGIRSAPRGKNPVALAGVLLAGVLALGVGGAVMSYQKDRPPAAVQASGYVTFDIAWLKKDPSDRDILRMRYFTIDGEFVHSTEDIIRAMGRKGWKLAPSTADVLAFEPTGPGSANPVVAQEQMIVGETHAGPGPRYD